MTNNTKPIMNEVRTRMGISNKKWVICFGIMTILGVLILALFNYVYDPYHYFEKDFSGVYAYSQYYKINYIYDNPDEYQCFVIGGSNSGAINPDLIQEYTGMNTYSLFFTLGNWYNYYNYCQFLVDNTSVECIVLHLSSIEVLQSKEKITANPHGRAAPAITKNNSFEIVKEKFEFLLKAIRFDKEGEGEVHRLKENGMLDWAWLPDKQKEEPFEYANEWVLNDYEKQIAEMGNVDLERENIEEALHYASKIKEICDENDVELIVIAGPIFISNRAQFECNDYYDYLERLVNITDVYDFSGINKFNANPYNFFDKGHYNYAMANKEISFVFGDENVSDNFGIKLTNDNVVDYLVERKYKFNELLKEYETIGTIIYEEYDSDSRVRE